MREAQVQRLEAVFDVASDTNLHQPHTLWNRTSRQQIGSDWKLSKVEGVGLVLDFIRAIAETAEYAVRGF